MNRLLLISYAAFQYTNRDHYTGIFPDDSLQIVSHIENAPYGISDVVTANMGVQLNHEFLNFCPTGSNVFTFGTELLWMMFMMKYRAINI